MYFYPEANGSIGSIGINGNRYYYVRNAQNDIIGITDKTGAFVARYTYDEWGVITSITDGNGNGVDVSSNPNHIANLNPLRYRSYFYDTETGWYWLNTRYYNPEVGRFVNADGEIAGIGGDVMGYNMFAYCMNNPINMSDPSGNWPRWITAAVGLVAVGVATVASPAVAAVAVGVATVSIVAYVAQSAHYDAREAMNDPATLPQTAEDADKAGWINSNPISENNPNGGGPAADCHQHTATNGPNVKYVSPDGHREVIYNSAGDIVLDSRDIGTYNYCPSNELLYSNASIGHLAHDIIPWVIFGNNDDDPGPIANRIISLFE